ncbi:MAG: hypothetical protein WCB12_20795 [Bryobacteraceae bacterium]
MRLAAARITAVVVGLLVCGRGIAADSGLRAYVNSLKGKQFVLRANQELFGRPRQTAYYRMIYETDITAEKDFVKIGGNADWQGRYFVPAPPRMFTVKDLHFDDARDRLQVKLWGPKVPRAKEDEIRLNFTDLKSQTPESLNHMFFAVFFSPGEPVEQYVVENDKRLVETYLDVYPELARLPTDSRMKVLSAIRQVSSSGRPQLEKVGEDLYIPDNLIGDDSVYNEISVSKNQRIASSIEHLLPQIKLAAVRLQGLPAAIHGVRFYWTIMHRDFARENEYQHSSDSMEMLVSLESIEKLAAGNLSVVEMLQEATLREDGTKITLSSYDPIGAR